MRSMYHQARTLARSLFGPSCAKKPKNPFAWSPSVLLPAPSGVPMSKAARLAVLPGTKNSGGRRPAGYGKLGRRAFGVGGGDAPAPLQGVNRGLRRGEVHWRQRKRVGIVLARRDMSVQSLMVPGPRPSPRRAGRRAFCSGPSARRPRGTPGSGPAAPRASSACRPMAYALPLPAPSLRYITHYGGPAAARFSTFFTVWGSHFAPRAVAIPRALRAAAIWRRDFAPAA